MGDGSVAVLGGMICCTGWRIIAILVCRGVGMGSRGKAGWKHG